MSEAAQLLNITAEQLEADPSLKAEILALDQVFEANPLERYNNPLLPNFHHKQMEFHAHKAGPLGTKLLLASNRSGKTVCGVADDTIQLIAPDLVPDHLKAFKKWDGPVTIWVGAPKNENHFNNTIPLFRRFVPRDALVEGKWGKSFKSQPNPRLVLANGSEVAFKTYDQDLDAWAGAEVHRIHWDEEPNGANASDLREEARYRLASTEGDELITMTPVLGAYSWVNDEVWARRDQPNIFAMKMKIWDNPWNSKEVVAQLIEEAKARGEDAYRTRIEAEFVFLGGLFYPEFREDAHIVAPPSKEQVADLEVVVSIDPGSRRTGVTWTGFDSDNSALVFAELESREGITGTAEEIHRINKAWGVEDPEFVIDPAFVIASKLGSEQVQAAYAREEIYCQGGQKDRRVGIMEVQRRLGLKTLLFSRECHQTTEQVRTYARNPKSNDEWAAIPQTDRVRHDLVDSLRYGVLLRAWEEADEPPAHRPTFQPDFQPPFSEERGYFQNDAPPYGDAS